MVSFFIGNCHLIRKDFAAAQKAYTDAVARNPAFVEAWLNLAKTFYEQQNFERAAGGYATAYEKSHQGNADSLYFSALSYLMANRHQMAASGFQRLFANHPDRITLQWRGYYVQALIGADQPRQALPLIRILAEQSSGAQKAKWQEMLLYQYLQREMHNEALAHVHLSEGNTKGALADLTIYSFLTPLTDQEKKLWADLNLQVNIPDRAAAQYLALLKENPDEETLLHLVIAYQRLDQSPKALDLLVAYAPETKSPGILIWKTTQKRYKPSQNKDFGSRSRRIQFLSRRHMSIFRGLKN